MSESVRVLIVAESASARFGGEAALPLHYYRVLRARGISAWLLVHERTRAELLGLYPHEADRMFFVPDTRLHRVLWLLSRWLPTRLAVFSTGFAMRLATQWAQRKRIEQLVGSLGISVIHQPMPVSPREPSMLFGLGVPVVIGPMNGGMDYPPAFRRMQSRLVTWTMAAGRATANQMNRLIPGKRRAACLLVANERTRAALPACLSAVPTAFVVENGVDLTLWQDQERVRPNLGSATPQFVYLGRLVDWKAVDLLLLAFARAAASCAMHLQIIGDGTERPALEAQARALDILGEPTDAGKVHFAGWRSQAQCAELLQQADALVLPSLMECGGAVVLEAMAMAKPVIATQWGGPMDYLDEDCGILVPPTSRDVFVTGLANALLELAQAPAQRLALGQAGQAKILREFDWEVKVDQVLQIYLTAMQRAPQFKR